jgi:hypothetical protein
MTGTCALVSSFSRIYGAFILQSVLWPGRIQKVKIKTVLYILAKMDALITTTVEIIRVV